MFNIQEQKLELLGPYCCLKSKGRQGCSCNVPAINVKTRLSGIPGYNSIVKGKWMGDGFIVNLKASHSYLGEKTCSRALGFRPTFVGTKSVQNPFASNPTFQGLKETSCLTQPESCRIKTSHLKPKALGPNREGFFLGI